MRPVEVRQRAREERLITALQALEARIVDLEQRLSADLTAEGHQIGWAASALGRRIDDLDRRLERATVLARSGLEELELVPDRRIVQGFAGQASRAICSLAIGPYIELLGLTAPGYAAYARRWGWDLVLSTEDLSDGRPAPWAKVPLVRELLDDYEWVLWIDADAAFVDLDADIGAEQEPGKDLYLVEHRWENPPRATANTGVFMLRSSQWSRELLDAMWARGALIEHEWWENAALLELLGYELLPRSSRLIEPTALMTKVKFLDLAWNSVGPNPAPHPRINHHGGGTAIEHIRELLLDDAATLRTGRSGQPYMASNCSELNVADTRQSLVRSIRSREQLPGVLNALGLTGRGAEVGVRKGEFSEVLLSLWHGDQLLSIDPWQEDDADSYRDVSNVSGDDHERFFGEAQGRLSAFGSRSQIWRLASVDAARQVGPGSLDFAYIDARHDEATVTQDLELWWPKIRVGGILAGHDYVDGELPAGTFAVKSAVDRFFSPIGLPVHVTTDDEPWPSWIVLRTS